MHTRNRGFHRDLVRLWAGAWSIWVGLACLACTPEGPARPSLVLLTVDRLAADRLGCFGGPPETASSLCALGADGFRFAWATTPSLGEASAAASLLTGLRPEVHGVGDQGIDFLADRHETIAEGLAHAGYTTGAFVTSPRLNRARRLDQGFDDYDDRLMPMPGEAGSASIARANAIRDWIEQAGSPFFLWIHLRSEPGLDELDRLIDRLARVLERDEDGPGLLFVALAGDSSTTRSGSPARGSRPVHSTNDNAGSRGHMGRIEVATYRVPLLWRPPGGAPAPAIHYRLASVLDVLPTLRAAAGLPPMDAHVSPELATGWDLAALARAPGSREPGARPDEVDTETETGGSRPGEARNPTERFLLLKTPNAAGPEREVGLASEHFLYVRRMSPLDGSGRPVPAPDLRALEARYAKIEPPVDESQQASPTAALAPPIWQREILRSPSPVPRLELHLARLLADPEPSRSSP